MIDDLLQLIRLLDDLDDEDFEFDVESDESTTPARSGGNRRSSRGRSGRDKYEMRRKVKKINRRLKKIERDENADLEELFESEPPNVRFVETDAGWRIVVDAAGAELELNGSDVVITVRGQEVRRTLDNEPELIERTEKLGTTVFAIAT